MNKLTKHITFKVTEEEYEKIKEYTKEVGAPTSKVIRALLLTTIDRHTKAKEEK